MPDGAATAGLVRARRHIGHARTSAGSGRPPGASGSGGGGGGTGKRCDGASAASAVPNHHSSTLKLSTAATRPGRAASTAPKQDCSSMTRSVPRRRLRAASKAALLALALRAAHACTSSSRARTSRMRISASSGLCVLVPRVTNTSLPAACEHNSCGTTRKQTNAPVHEARALHRSMRPWVQRHESALKARPLGLTLRSFQRCVLRKSVSAACNVLQARCRQRHVPASRPEGPC